MLPYLHQETVRVRRWAPYENCSAPAILHFPYLGLPDGVEGTFLPIVVLIYFLISLTLLCYRYFLPALSEISDTFSSEVVRATVMSIIATIPEMAVTVIGTFLTEADVGASAIVGSALFNTLVIPGICALTATGDSGSKVNVWDLTRDSFMYGLSLLCLAIFFQGDVVQWYEAISMVMLYALYLGGIQIDKCLRRRTASIYYKVKWGILENTPLTKMGGETIYPGGPLFYSSCDEAILREEAKDHSTKIKESWYEKLYYWTVWPITICMKVTIPTFTPWCTLVACSIWIAAISYTISWVIAVIGYKLRIPDSLMGFTVLGMGVGMPELMISLGVARKGKGTMALCNALGSNIINTLLCLSLPWIIKMSLYGTNGIPFNTDGLSYNCFLTLIMVFILYLAMALNKFILDKKIGYFLLTLYTIFSICITLIEMNVFFKANLPICNIKDYFND